MTLLKASFPPWLSHLTLALFATTAVGFVVLPMQSVLTWFGSGSSMVEALTPFLIFLGGLATAIGYGLEAIWKRPASLDWETRGRGITFSSVSRWHWLLALLIFAQACFFLQRPLDLDEHSHAMALAQGSYQSELSITQSNNHLLAQLFTLVSTSLLGTTKVGMRLPTLFFVVLFLFSIGVLCQRRVSTFARTLLLLNCLANPYFVWYSHSSRGYLSLLALSTLSFALLLSCLDGKPNLKHGRWCLVALALNCFTHLFGALFSCLILMSLVFWAFFQRDRMKPSQLGTIRYLLLRSWSIVLIAGVVGVLQGLSIHDKGDLFSDVARGGFSGEANALFGFDRILMGKLLLLTTLFAIVFQLTQKKRTFSMAFDFNACFLVTSILFLLTITSLLDVRVMFVRFIFPFLPPAIFFIASQLQAIKQKQVRLATQAMALLLLVPIPLTNASKVPRLLLHEMIEFDAFVTQVQTHLSGDTCLSYSSTSFIKHGKKRKDDRIDWLKTLYFPPPHPNCEPTHLIGLRNTTPPPSRYRLVFRNDKGMSLWALRPSPVESK